MTPEDIPDWITARAERHFRDAGRAAARFEPYERRPEVELWPILRAALADVLTALGHRALPAHTPTSSYFGSGLPAGAVSADHWIRGIASIQNTVTGEWHTFDTPVNIRATDYDVWFRDWQRRFLAEWEEKRAAERVPTTPLEAVKQRLAAALGTASSGLVSGTVMRSAIAAGVEQQKREVAARACGFDSYEAWQEHEAEQERQAHQRSGADVAAGLVDGLTEGAAQRRARLTRESIEHHRWQDVAPAPAGHPEGNTTAERVQRIINGLADGTLHAGSGDAP
jgi:hypothetical protein